MKNKFCLVVALLLFSFFSSETFSMINTGHKQISGMASQKFDNYYVRVLVNGEWWMYVYSDPGGTVLIDRYKIEE
ncbi:MAG: hypothetical protein ABI840_09085 [bacterium]